MKKIISLAICSALLMSVLSGCGNTKKEAAVIGNKSVYGDTYPLQSDKTLTWWMPLNANMTVSADSMNKLEYSKELTRQTGVKVEYIHPALGQTTERFNLLLASGNLPDIIEFAWGNYPGGPQKAIDDKHILNHNEIIENFSPNFSRLLKENREVNRQVKTDAGNYFGYPMVTLGEGLRTTGGLIIREDWLTALRLDLPETIEEWYSVLTRFKNDKKAKAPLSINIMTLQNGAFIGAWDILYGFYSDGNGNIKYGPFEESYKDFLQTMAKWYEEDLIDSGFAVNDAATVSANMLNGTTAAVYGGLGGGIGRWMSAKKDDPEYQLTGAKYPVLHKGDVPKFGQFTPVAQVGSPVPAITTNCQDVELAARLLDYGYSEPGHMLNNFGIEDVSYTITDGYPRYTEVITNNGDGLSMSAALLKYSRAGVSGGGFKQDIRYLEQYASSDAQQKAWESWRGSEAEHHMLPALYVTSEEQSEFAKLNNAITTYVDEMLVKFITGIEPVEKFDKYIATLKAMNVERYIEIEAAAYKRYLNR